MKRPMETCLNPLDLKSASLFLRNPADKIITHLAEAIVLISRNTADMKGGYDLYDSQPPGSEQDFFSFFHLIYT